MRGIRACPNEISSVKVESDAGFLNQKLNPNLMLNLMLESDANFILVSSSSSSSSSLLLQSNAGFGQFRAVLLNFVSFLHGAFTEARNVSPLLNFMSSFCKHWIFT